MANVTVIAPAKAESTIHKIRCAAYCRVSSSSEDQLHSYAAQVKFYGEKFDDSVTEELIDIYADEGITGTSADKRTEFQRLIKDCKRGKIDRIYTKSLSRFARNTKECLNTVRLLRELGITIFFEKENIDTSKNTDELMITIMGGLAQEESTSISQNMRWSVRKRMENGSFVQSVPPYGYVKKDEKLAVDPETSETVKEIFRLYLGGMGTNTIAQLLNDRGILTGMYHKKWNHKIVKYILSNEKYIGDSLMQKTYKTETLPMIQKRNHGEYDQYYVENTHEAIISRADFQKVREMLSMSASKFHRESNGKHILGSMIKCGECGSTYKRKCNNGKYYWSCIEHDLSSQNCNSKPVAEEAIMQAFTSLCNKLIQHYKEILLPLRRNLQELNMRKFSGNTKVLDIRKDMADLKEQRHVIARLRKRGFLDEKKYNEKLIEIESKMAKLDRELKKHTKTDSEDETLEHLDVLIDCFECQSSIMSGFNEELFGMIVEKVIVRNNMLEFSLISGIVFKEKI